MTGHEQGLITLYIKEADDAVRERSRLEMSEVYRTLLGHFRHESGHYYCITALLHYCERLLGSSEHFTYRAL